MPGRLEAVAGCMFSGKTEKLQEIVRKARIQGKVVLLLKPTTDTRYSIREVVSHNRGSLLCATIKPEISEIEELEVSVATFIAALTKEHVGNLPFLPSKQKLGKYIVKHNADMIAFSEGHFFGKQTFPCIVQKLIEIGITVVVEGLDLNWKAEPFEPMATIIKQAGENVTELKAICVKCGGDANRTQRIDGNGDPIGEGPEILVGGAEAYEARCDGCYVHPKDVP